MSGERYMSELEKLLLEYEKGNRTNESEALLLEMLRMERRTVKKLIADLKEWTLALDDSCAYPDIDACSIMQNRAVRALIN